MKPLRLALIIALLGMGSCGRVADLKPAAGKPPPLKPLMARSTPTPRDLLAVPPYAKPDRVDELVQRSQPRPQDGFDLPPPTGGAAPAHPAGTDPQPVANETGPATPKE